jgi:hypothetical protein
MKKQFGDELEAAYQAADVGSIRAIYKRVKKAKDEAGEKPADGEMF